MAKNRGEFAKPRGKLFQAFGLFTLEKNAMTALVLVSQGFRLQYLRQR